MILGISGKRGSGKSLLAKNLEKFGFKRVSLADNLKDRCMADFALHPEQVRGCLKEQSTQYKSMDGKIFTPRDIMIRMGMFYRSIDELFWCKTLQQNIDHSLDKNFVIDDIRFINEIYYFKSKGAQFVRLEREAELNIYKTDINDPSETELDSYKDWDHLLLARFNRTALDLDKYASYLAEHCL